MEYFTYDWIEKYIVLQEKTVIWCRLFIFSTAFAIMPSLNTQVHIPIRKDDFVFCMVKGFAMHLNGVTVTIALTSGNWGIIYTTSLESFSFSLGEPLRDKTKTKLNQLWTRVD